MVAISKASAKSSSAPYILSFCSSISWEHRRTIFWCSTIQEASFQRLFIHWWCSCCFSGLMSQVQAAKSHSGWAGCSQFPVVSWSCSSCCYCHCLLVSEVGRVTTCGQKSHEAAAGRGKGPETASCCLWTLREVTSSRDRQLRRRRLGLSIPLMTLGHLSEPFIDGLASSPKGCCPPSCSAHSWEAGRWVGAFAAVTRASSHRKKRCGVFNFLLSSNSEKLFLWKQYLHT